MKNCKSHTMNPPFADTATEASRQRSEGRAVEIVIYRFTGWQGLFKIPNSWCRECDLLLRATERAVRAAKAERWTRIIVRPWFLWFWKPLILNGACHAPILTVNGHLVSQGVVPAESAIVSAISESGEAK